eukprot:COSAG01_NODE_247_length_20443_cov_52.339543_22_plen_556_part_00
MATTVAPQLEGGGGGASSGTVRRPTVLLTTTDACAAYVEQLELGVLSELQLVPPLHAADSSTGNLNYCYVVERRRQQEPGETFHGGGGGGGSVFVKQAPDFVRCLGHTAKLTTERIRTEALAAAEFGRLAQGSVPALYHFDEAGCVLVMEHLRSHRLLQDAISTGDISDGPAHAVATFMGRVHSATFCESLPADRAERLCRRFDNAAMCGITSAYVFTKPFDGGDESNSHPPQLQGQAARLRASPEVREAVAALHQTFRTKKQCLCHGDLHAGSVMVAAAAPVADTGGHQHRQQHDVGGGSEGLRNECGGGGGRRCGDDTRVIDHEFAFVGPAGFDLGLFLAGWLFPYAAAAARRDEAAVRKIRSAMRACVGTYLPMLPAGAAPRVWAEALGFMGVELLRRVLGVAKRAELESIRAAPVRLTAQQLVLEVGERAVLWSASLLAAIEKQKHIDSNRQQQQQQQQQQEGDDDDDDDDDDDTPPGMDDDDDDSPPGMDDDDDDDFPPGMDDASVSSETDRAQLQSSRARQERRQGMEVGSAADGLISMVEACTPLYRG